MTHELITDAASHWGVSLEYRDATGRVRESPLEAVMEVLSSLAAHTSAGPWSGTGTGRQIETRDREWLREAADSRRTEVRDRLLPPVLVSWDGRLRFEVPAGAKATLKLDAGCTSESGSESDQSLSHTAAASGPSPWKVVLPFGYHELRLDSGVRSEQARVISAPRRCWQQGTCGQQWGVFTPTYALRGETDRGAGDLSQVDHLLEVVSAAGGSAVATLPLLASYLDRPFEPSPYRPVSRLFWNEFYLALDQMVDWDGCASARAVWESSAAEERLTEWRASDLVDYAGVMALKRRALEELCRYFFGTGRSERVRLLERFVRERPDVLKYAEFRATVEGRGDDWRSWPRSEAVAATPTSLDQLSEAGRYHVYCQWQMEEQLRQLAGSERQKHSSDAGGGRAGLFLDLPVGVHPGGFDVWEYKDLFVRGMSIGSPPDAFFGHGQSWDAPPLHPAAVRSDGHAYWSGILSHHMRFASRLRIDHIMSLHRLFWIPDGRDPKEGVYVTYPADELYAVLCLESHRNKTMVTGEDLGTVPPEVRPRMRRHGVSRTWVLQSALRPRAKSTIAPIPDHAVASLGTHDMFPFAGFLAGADIRMRLQTGQLEEDEARRALAARRRIVSALSSYLTGASELDDPRVLLAATLSYLARSPTEFVLVGLDDLLMQHEAHNVPGTHAGATNWRRRLGWGEAQVERAVHEAAEWLDRS